MNKFLNPYKYYRRIYEKIGPEPKVAFLHIPKTGGTYIDQAQSGVLPVLWPIKYYNHSVVISENNKNINIKYPPKGLEGHPEIYIEDISKYFVFTSVRNLFSWFLSYYNHVMWRVKIVFG